jgi:hypothetical protein
MQLTPLARLLVHELDKPQLIDQPEKISVNPVVSEVAAWYEKLRNAMEYREDEVLLRAAIERILKRRMLLSKRGQDVAPALVRELVWARYFPDSSVPEALIHQVAQQIDLHFTLRKKIKKLHHIKSSEVNEWIMDILTSKIEDILKPRKEKDLLCSFAYQIFKEKVNIVDDKPGQLRDAQVFIAVRRALGREDRSLLRFQLFEQYFGEVKPERIDLIAQKFEKGYQEINTQLSYPQKDKIYSYIKNQIAPFFILKELLRKHKGKLSQLLKDDAQFKEEVLVICEERYKSILSRVNRAVLQSVVFIFITKSIFALLFEATFESLIYSRVYWINIAINTLFSPLLMIIVGLVIATPGKENSERILERVESVLTQNDPKLNKELVIDKNTGKVHPVLQAIYMILWGWAFFLAVNIILSVLGQLHFNAISKAVFLFFLAIVSFLAYRINQLAQTYTIVPERQGWSSLLFDFFFLPFIYAGRQLTNGIAQINIFLFIFDYIIETPFKEIFAFFEHWFLFLRSQRDTLG